MTRLSQKVLVQCPLAQGLSHLQQFFERRREPDGSAIIRLRLPLRGPVVEHDVIVRVHDVPRANDMTEGVEVTWEPVGGGPFPTFDGKLRVESDEDYHTFWLVLDGEYKPPLGVVGAAFDAIIGRMISNATASEFLGEIAHEAEMAFATDEATKKGTV